VTEGNGVSYAARRLDRAAQRSRHEVTTADV
jgi:hypothetical protein